MCRFPKNNTVFNRFPIFRKWVPEWLVRIILFTLFLPGIMIFFLPLANIPAAAGYYGCEPADIQFAVALFYAGYAGFYALERRFFSFLAAKEYFILYTCLNIALIWVCYRTTDLLVLFPVRFVQGMLFASTVNLSLSTMFTRLKSERAREISFSVFFGVLICALPFDQVSTAGLIDAADFNVIYKFAMFSYAPGLLLLIISMNNIRLVQSFPLKKLDWPGFVIYTLLLVLIGYCLIFGQEYYWLEDRRIRYGFLVIVGLSVIYVIRQKHMKRPYIDLSVFRFRNYLLGILLLFIMYICRFAIGITNTYFLAVLKLDPIHVSYINLWNIAGLVLGVIIACVLILQQKNIRFIWLSGFGFLLVYYSRMFFLFNPDANEQAFHIPLFIQGLGVGWLMVPTIIFAISSVPKILGVAASAYCLATRYLGFCVSIALINYYELLGKSKHYNTFQDRLTLMNPVVKKVLASNMHKLSSHGLTRGPIVKGSEKLLVSAVNRQNQLRFGMDYYELMSWVLIGTILFVAFFPYLNKTAVYLKSKILTPA